MVEYPVVRRDSKARKAGTRASSLEQCEDLPRWLLQPGRQPVRVRLKAAFGALPQYAVLELGRDYLALLHEAHPDYMDVVAPLVLYARQEHFEIAPIEQDPVSRDSGRPTVHASRSRGAGARVSELSDLLALAVLFLLMVLALLFTRDASPRDAADVGLAFPVAIASDGSTGREHSTATLTR
jgi:hypothetical protein